MKNVFIEGERIFLAALEEYHADGNYPGWFNDAEVCRGNGHHRYPYSREQAIEFIRSARKDSTLLVVAVMLKDGDIHIGNMSLQRIDYLHATAEYAVLMGESAYWGKGYAHEAGVLLFKHAFEELHLQRIACATLDTNQGMRKLALSLGMREEGVRRRAFFKGGTYHDFIEFGVLKEEFFAVFECSGMERTIPEY